MSQFERDCKEFKFKQLIKLQVDSWTGSSQHRAQRVAVASKYGLAFVATSGGFKALKVVDIIKKDIENPNCANEVIKDFQYVADIDLKLCPDDLSVSNDCKFLSVCVRKNDLVFALIYAVHSFVQTSPVLPLVQVKLCSGGNVHLGQLMWNPGADYPSMFASTVSDGSLALFKVTDTGFSIQASLPTAAAKCLCWSPKGKQLVVGTIDGKLIQFDQNLAVKKTIPGPTALFNGQSFTTVDVLWESTYVFFAAYLLNNSEHEQPHLMHVVAAKGAEPVYMDLEDACFGGGEGRAARYYSSIIPQWNMLLLASATSLEGAVLGRSPSQEGRWERWILDDAGRAELPLTEDYEEVFPMGFAIDFSSDISIPIGDSETLPPCPVLLMLGTNGMLVCYYMIHSSAPASIQRLPEVQVSSTRTLKGEITTTPVKPSPSQQPSTSVPQTTGQAQPSNQQPAPSATIQKQPTATSILQSTGQVQPTSQSPAPSATAQRQPAATSVPQAFGQQLTAGSATVQNPPAATGFSFGQTKPPSQPTAVITTTQKQPTSNVPAASMTGQPLQSVQSLTSTPPGQVKQPGFGGFGTRPSVSATTQINKQPAFGSSSATSGHSMTPQNVVVSPSPGQVAISSTPGQMKQPPTFGSPSPFTQSMMLTPTQPKASASASSSLTSAPQKQQQATPTGTLSFGSLRTDQAAKMGTSQMGETRSSISIGQGQVSSAQRVGLKTTGLSPSLGGASSIQATQELHRPQASVKTAPKDAPPPQQESRQPTSVSPTKRSASREGEDGGGRGGGGGPSTSHSHAAPSQQQQKPGQEHYMKALMEEMHHFELELSEFRRRGGSSLSEVVGSKEEMVDIHSLTESVLGFCEDIKHTTQSLNNEIHALKSECLEEFATLEECRAREERNQNPGYRHLLGARSLDPVSERKMRSIRSQAHYLEAGIRDVDSKLDLEWEEWRQGKRNGRSLKLPTTDTIYRTLKNNTRVISTQQSALDNMCSGLGKPHLGKVRGLQTTTGLTSPSTPADTSQWSASKGYQPRSLQSVNRTPRSVVSPRPLLSGQSPQGGGSVSPEKQSKLREMLGSRRVTPIKSTAPENLSMSRFWSPNLHEDSNASLASSSSPVRSSQPDRAKAPINPAISQKSPTMKSPVGLKPIPKATMNKESQQSRLSMNAATTKASSPTSSSFTFSAKSSGEFQGFGTKQPAQTSKESTTLMSGLNTSSKPAPNFSFSKTSTPVTKSSTGGAGFSFAAKPDTTFSFSKSSAQDQAPPEAPKTADSLSAPTSTAGSSSTSFTAPSTGFNFSKTPADKSQAKNKSTGSTGTFSFGAKQSESFSFSKPPDVTKVAEPKKVLGFDQVNADSSISSLPRPTPAADVNPRLRLGTDMSGSFSFSPQTTDAMPKAAPSQKGDGKAMFSGFGSGTGSTSVTPAKQSELPDSSSQPTSTQFDVASKHMQFGSAFADVLAEDSSLSTPSSGGLFGQSKPSSSTGLFGQTKGATSGLFSFTPQAGTQSKVLPVSPNQSTTSSVMVREDKGKAAKTMTQQNVVTTTEKVQQAEVMAKKAPATAQPKVLNFGDSSKPSALIQALGGEQAPEDLPSQGDRSEAPTQLSNVTSTSGKALFGARSASPSALPQGTDQPQKLVIETLPTPATTTGQSPASAGFKFTSLQSGDHQAVSSTTQGATQQQTAVEISSQQPTTQQISSTTTATSGGGFSFGGSTNATTFGSFGSSSKQPSSSTGFSFGASATPTTTTGSGSQGVTPTTSSGQNVSSNTQPSCQAIPVQASTASIPATSAIAQSGTQQPSSSTTTGFGFGMSLQTGSTASIPTSLSSAQIASNTTTTIQPPAVSSTSTTAPSTAGFSFGTAQTSSTSSQPQQQAPPSGNFGFGSGLSTGFGLSNTTASATTGGGAPPATFSFGQQQQPQPTTTSGDGMKGMESEGTSSTQDSSLFGSGNGLFGGLGGKPSAENANKNPFGSTFGAPNTGTGSQGLFGSQTTSVLGGGGGGFGTTSSQGGGTLFSGNSSAGVSSTGFGVGGGQQTSPNKTAFGGAPVFGSGMAAGNTPSFGSPPPAAAFGSGAAFGGAPGFGSNTPVFGSTAAPNTGGFAGFASSGAPSFGNLAQQNPPTFGNQDSGGFGAAQNNPQGFGNNSGFGAPQKMSSPSFSSYRS